MAMQINTMGMAMMIALRKKARETGEPIHATFELTPRCGYNCRMCYVHLPAERIPEVGNGRELTAAEWLDLGRQSAEMGVLSICITGGDPLCHPEFETIWEGLSQMGFRLILQTNASMITPRYVELFEKYPPDTVKITLYGSNDQVCRDVCRVEKGFTRADEGIKALQKLDIPIQLVTTFIRQNKEDFANIQKYANENNLAWIYSTCCYPSLRGADSEADECALDVWDFGCAEETAKEWSEKKMKDDRLPASYCRGYRTEFTISWDGEMRFCNFVDEPHIKMSERSLKEAWQELLDFCEALTWPDECISCEDRHECRRCLAMLACHNGGLHKVTTEYCEKVRNILNADRT